MPREIYPPRQIPPYAETSPPAVPYFSYADFLGGYPASSYARVGEDFTFGTVISSAFLIDDYLAVYASGYSRRPYHRFVVGYPLNENTSNYVARQGLPVGYTSPVEEHYFGALTTNELTDRQATISQAWVKYTAATPATQGLHHTSEHISDWTHSGSSLQARCLDLKYTRVNACTGTTPVDFIDTFITQQYFGASTRNMGFFGLWINHGNLYGSAAATDIPGGCAMEVDAPIVSTSATAQMNEVWHERTASVTGYTEYNGIQMILTSVASNNVNLWPTASYIADGWKQGILVGRYKNHGIVISPEGLSYGGGNLTYPASTSTAIYITDWDKCWANKQMNTGILLQRGDNGVASGYSADIYVSVSAASSAFNPFYYQRGTTGGLDSHGGRVAISATGDISTYGLVSAAGYVSGTGSSGLTQVITMAGSAFTYEGGILVSVA